MFLIKLAFFVYTERVYQRRGFGGKKVYEKVGAKMFLHIVFYDILIVSKMVLVIFGLPYKVGFFCVYGERKKYFHRQISLFWFILRSKASMIYWIYFCSIYYNYLLAYVKKGSSFFFRDFIFGMFY